MSPTTTAWTKASIGRLRLGADEHPPKHKRVLLLEDRGNEAFGDYVVAAESIPERAKTANQHYKIIAERVNNYECLQAEVASLRAAAGDQISRSEMLEECDRWLEKVKVPRNEREDGARVTLVRLVKNLRAIAVPLPVYLDCMMCGATESFVIDPHDSDIGYCFVEKQAWKISTLTGKEGK